MRITKVAIKREGIVYALPPPNRHHHIFPIMPAKADSEDYDEQGFVLENGEFVDRSTAFVIALGNNQLNRRMDKGYSGTLLFSEDLW